MKHIFLGLILVCAFGIGTPTLARAQSLPPVPQPSPTPSPSHPAPTPIINLVFQWNFNVITEAVQKALQDVFGGIAQGIQQHVFLPITQSPLNFLTQTPPAGTYANPTVIALWGYTRDVASLGFVVVLVLCGYAMMAGRLTATPFADALHTLRTAILGLLLANTSLWWIALVIDLENRVTAGIGAVSLPTVATTGFAGNALETIFLGIVYLIMGILLVLQMLMRLALLDILLILAPLAVLVGVLPWGRHWARLWTDLLVGTLLTQFAQILALRLGTGLLIQLVPSLADRVLSVLAGIAVLWLVLKLPGLLHAGLHRAGGSASPIGTVLTVRAVSHVLARSGGSVAAATAGGAGGPIALISTPVTSSTVPGDDGRSAVALATGGRGRLTNERV